MKTRKEYLLSYYTNRKAMLEKTTLVANTEVKQWRDRELAHCNDVLNNPLLETRKLYLANFKKYHKVIECVGFIEEVRKDGYIGFRVVESNSYLDTFLVVIDKRSIIEEIK